MRRVLAVVSAGVLGAALAVGMVFGVGPAARVSAVGAATTVTPPPAHARWDYQIGGARSTPASVGVVTRDRHDRPVAGVYNVCYVNAFQTQVEEKRFWRQPAHWRLVLKHGGRPVVDSGWGEWVLDTRTPAKRRDLAAIVGGWIRGCATKGFDAVEFDNLDSFDRSAGLISRADNKAMAALLTVRAHDAGLAAGQKNWPELGGQGPRLGFDFAVAEQCGQYHECGRYVATYGAEVLAVEYSNASFTWACDHYADQISLVRRDVDVTPTGPRRWCRRS